MDCETVMQELEALGKERMKKTYISNGAHDITFLNYRAFLFNKYAMKRKKPSFS